VKYLYLLAAVFILSSCSTRKYEKTQYASLKTLEKQLVNTDLTLNKEVADSLYRESLFFDSIFPKSTHKEEVLTLAAKSADGLNKNQENIKIIELLLRHFPQSKNAPIYLYNKGKIYEEKIGNINKAISIYQQIIEIYPDHELAKSLAHYIPFLQKSPQEQLDSFK
jgi:tetratricopeptide (TPR) repeat protein